MANKKCMVFETLNNVGGMKITEAKDTNDGLMRLSGVFGVAGVQNENHRIYDKANYGKMVEELQQQIKEKGCAGELEHPNSMNIDLNNVSHKIESIQMNEDGTVTGTIVLLNTPKGQIAKSIIEGGLPLYISSRGAGTITNEGKVTLSTLKTYDLVGTPGFSQAEFHLDKNQKFENLNESLDDENTNCWAVITEGDVTEGDVTEGDDLLDDKGSDDKSKNDTKKDNKSSDDKGSDKDDKSDDNKSDDKTSDNKDNKDEKSNDKKDNTEVSMEDLKSSIEALTDKVNQLEASLHVAQEDHQEVVDLKNAISEVKESVNTIKPTNYEAIQKWVTEEWAPEFEDHLNDTLGNDITESIANGVQSWVVNEFAPEVQNWVCEEFAPEVQNWVCEEFAPEVQNWVCEEFAPEVQNWVCEEFAPEVQNWVCEEFAPEVQNWITEEFSPTIENWLNEEYTPENNKVLTESIENKVNSNVSAFLENNKSTRLENIDAMLETLENGTTSAVDAIVNEQKDTDKYASIYAVSHMPSQYQPSWNMLSEARKDEIVQSAKAYDFTKQNVLENFWANVDFNKQAIVEQKQEVKTPQRTYQDMIAEQMKKLRPVY